jgi:hypothetical protein
MPSPLHEALLQLFRNRPELAPELLRDTLQAELPAYSEVRIDSADLSEVQPAEYRADMVALLLRGEPVMGIVVEVQLSTDDRKSFAWPAYVTNLRARLRCPVYLLVIAGDETVARWAARPIDLGGGYLFSPWVLRPGSVPEITDSARAQADPELAVLSAMSHGKDTNVDKAIQIALTACEASSGLDDERSKLYCDAVIMSLSALAQQEMQLMNIGKYEYQSDFARKFVAQGRSEGEISGRASLINRQLAVRFGPATESIRARIAQASIAELEDIAERLLFAKTIEEALGST